MNRGTGVHKNNSFLIPVKDTHTHTHTYRWNQGERLGLVLGLHHHVGQNLALRIHLLGVECVPEMRMEVKPVSRRWRSQLVWPEVQLHACMPKRDPRSEEEEKEDTSENLIQGGKRMHTRETDKFTSSPCNQPQIQPAEIHISLANTHTINLGNENRRVALNKKKKKKREPTAKRKEKK
jgi:hypothetical protein